MSAPTITRYGSATQFLHSPVVFQAAPTGSGINGTFYRLKVKLYAELVGYINAEFDFSIPIETKYVNGSLTAQNALFDISSALQAVAEKWQPDAPSTLPNSYPEVKYYMTAHEEWMVDGAIYSSDAARFPASSRNTMYMGALTDRERLSSAIPAKYGRKPTSSREICFIGSRVIVPGPTSGAPSIIHCVAGEPSDASVFNTLNYYAIHPPLDGYEIRFINSLGVHENVFVYGLPKKETHITTEQYVIARQETLTQFSRGLAIKKNDYETWHLSSGPIDEEWASWYIHEFLMLRWIWIRINNHWTPCHVLPDETTLLNDRINPSRHEVQFKLQLDINGSPL